MPVGRAWRGSTNRALEYVRESRTVTVTKVRTLVTEILVLQPRARRLHSESHNVVTAVDVHYFTGNTGTRIRSQEYSGRADFIYVYVALQGRALRV
jgi:hypothetical protein